MPSLKTVFPTEQEQAVARESSHRLAGATELRIRKPKGDEFVLVPARIAHLFQHILGLFAQGKAVTIVPNEAMQTTQDAADFLHVSRPFLIKLLEEHNVFIHKVGNRRKSPSKKLNAFSNYWNASPTRPWQRSRKSIKPSDSIKPGSIPTEPAQRSPISSLFTSHQSRLSST
jgi:hypothetical protein